MGLVVFLQEPVVIHPKKTFKIAATGNLGDNILFEIDGKGSTPSSKQIKFTDIIEQMKKTISSGKLESCFADDIEQSVDRLVSLYF